MKRYLVPTLWGNVQAVSGVSFWLVIGVLGLLKLALTADVAVQMIYSPHDDGLYVSRAYHLLMGEAFGPYDARLLVKLPGISLWMAANRILGIPYLLSINLLYIGAGLYLIAALQCAGYRNRALLFGVFLLYLFNPVTLDPQWFRIMREPLSIVLLVFMLASMVFILTRLRERKISFIHHLVFTGAFAFSLLVREEDRLLYGLLILFGAAMFWASEWESEGRSRIWWAAVAFTVALPVVAATGTGAMVRSYVAKHYGTPVVHDFGDGEFPKLIAAMRSVESKKDNRHVMITQEALGRLRQEVPRLAPVIDRLPPPSPDSYSCQRFRVCSEWTNGWMLFWIKDAAHHAGLTPDARAAQAFFRAARLDIEQACSDGRLNCRNKGSGLLPTFELRWTRALVHEAIGILKMMFVPGFGVAQKPPTVYPVDVDYGRMYQAVTMTPYYDTALQLSNQHEAWKSYPKEMYLGLRYWLRYPDVASSKDFGVMRGGDKLGAHLHYQQHGRHEGRVWEETTKVSDEWPYHYRNRLASWRPAILKLYERIGLALMLLGVVALAARLLMASRVPMNPLVWITTVFFGFTLLRLASLSYVSVYMGGLDGRLFFSTYVVVLTLSPVLVFDCVRTYREMRAANSVRGNWSHEKTQTT